MVATAGCLPAAGTIPLPKDVHVPVPEPVTMRPHRAKRDRAAVTELRPTSREMIPDYPVDMVSPEGSL